MYNYQRLKDLREDKDMNQEEIGKIIETSACYYGAYENGKRDIPFARVIKLAKYYNVSLDYIAGLTNDKGGLHYLDKEEQEIIEYWRNMKPKYRTAIKINMEALSDKKMMKTEKKSVV